VATKKFDGDVYSGRGVQYFASSRYPTYDDFVTSGTRSFRWCRGNNETVHFTNDDAKLA